MKPGKILFIFIIFSQVTGINAHTVKWHVDDGWVLRQNEEKKYEKFFAIGVWGIPGYQFNRLSVEEEKKKYPNNKNTFLSKIKDFNLFYIQSEFGKKYMDNVIKMGGTREFSWNLEYDYLNNTQNYASYYMMREIEKDLNSSKLVKNINSAIDYTLKEVSTSKDLIWAPFDEVATGLQGWSWPNSLTDIVYTKIKDRTPDKLVFIDLLGSISLLGNSYLFQQNYKKTHKSLSQNPPFHALPKNVKSELRSLNDFFVDYQGNTIFEYNDGQAVLKEYDEITLQKIWFENLKKTANGYKNSGDIFGINAFQFLYKYPKLAGISVDAIKAGVEKDTPVWIFFDSNGYAKPPSISAIEYAKNIKAQIYTSIVHGATGVLFWSDLTKDDTDFKALLPIVKELKENETIFLYNTIEQKVAGDIHYIIKENHDKTKFLIAVNTNTKTGVYFLNEFSVKSFFHPLEVYITKLKIK